MQQLPHIFRVGILLILFLGVGVSLSVFFLNGDIGIFLTKTPTVSLTKSPLDSEGFTQALSVSYYIDCSCVGDQTVPTLIIRPFGGTTPYAIPNYDVENLSGDFVEEIRLLGTLGYTYNITLQSSDTPPMVWQRAINFNCGIEPVCPHASVPDKALPALEVTWDIVEKCSSNELEVTIIMSGGKAPYIYYPAQQFKFPIDEPQLIRIKSDDGQTWEAIIGPTGLGYCKE